MIGKFLLSFWILLRWISVLGDPEVAERWPTPYEESLDEVNDPEIFRAVVESMRQWELHRKNHRTKREISKVCYEDVGCFEDTGPFSYLEMLPSPPKEVGTRFLVYGSRKARSIPMEVPAEDINDNAHRAIDPDLPTKVIVHGFGSSCDQVWVYEMRSALMTVHECNIVCVDWEPGSAVPNYVRAAANTRLVGRQLAKFIRSLNISLNKVHLIGFSLGAHVAGFAGAELGNVSRITGLDPAAPLFESQDPRARLDETDANFVDVIHSNGEQLILGGLGSWQPMGDVDFYPNGGRMQTGCSNLFLGAVSDIIWSSTVEGRSLCNHRRAYKLFTDSVSPKCRFPAFPCDYGYDGLVRGDCFPCGVNGMDRPCGDMGYYSDESPARGQLYLITRDEEPFCAHQYQVKVYNSRSERPTKSYGKLEVTLIGETFNETFAMTKKDEELLVGVILQKIVVPHPAITNLESIEIKYTAYSGWISSGLVSWSIDKVAIVDSFGKTFSVCKKGLILESNRLIYLPLYPGECNIPLEADNVTSSGNQTALEELVIQSTEPKVSGSTNIGPFTKDQNYETRTKDGYTVGVFSNEKNLGPFTKEQNIQIPEDTEKHKKQEQLTVDGTETRRTDSSSNSPWSFIDLSNNADSNSLENSEIEIGRGFSGFNFIPRTSSSATDASTKLTTTEFQREIQEPVLQLKKETGRSLRLPEITEPILRPRTTRQNDIKNESNSISRIPSKQEIQESSTAPKSFTVQFLPERLASILAQAERYARQTLLPLISQYTPSFVGGDRFEEPKYFPPLGLIQGGAAIDESREIFNKVREYKFDEEPLKIQSHNNENLNDFETKKSTEGSSNTTDDEWIPVNSGSGRDSNSVSRSLNIFGENSKWTTSNGPRAVSLTTTTISPTQSQSKRMNEWIPITIPNDKTKHIDNSTVDSSKVEVKKLEDSSENKYIPLIDFYGSDNATVSPSSNANEVSQDTTSSPSHIQKIPRVVPTSVRPQKSLSTGKMMFPYVYERKKDPRTRYIPLIPEEDLGRSHTYIERDR